MNSTLTKTSVAILGVGVICLTAVGGPLQRNQVAGQPVWVAHVDCDALRPTALGQFVLAELEKPEAAAKLAAFESIFTFDPRKQLHGVTIYSTGAPDDGVLLLYADFNAERLTTLAKAAKEYQSATHNQHVIHSWIDDKKKPKNGVQPRTYAAIHGGKVIIFGQHEAPVAKALDVFDRAAPSLAATGVFPQMGSAADASAFIQATARKLDLPEGDPSAAIFKLARLLQLRVGEEQRQVKATLTFEANDNEVAEQISSVAQGLVALMKLQKDKPESVKVAEALAFQRDGARVVANLRVPADDLVRLIKADAARKAAKKAEKEKE